MILIFYFFVKIYGKSPGMNDYFRLSINRIGQKIDSIKKRLIDDRLLNRKIIDYFR